MATRKVSVERYVEQVRDGSHYKGYVKIVDTELKYELVFGVPIDRLDDMEPITDVNEIHRIFQKICGIIFSMPRTNRVSVGNIVYHVINRT